MLRVLATSKLQSFYLQTSPTGLCGDLVGSDLQHTPNMEESCPSGSSRPLVFLLDPQLPLYTGLLVYGRTRLRKHCTIRSSICCRTCGTERTRLSRTGVDQESTESY